MYIDILPNDNLPEATMATFKEIGPRQTVQAIRLHLDDGLSWCAITGWSQAGPVEALFIPIEESGDGPGRLVCGGEHGLRLQRIDAPENAKLTTWDLADTKQWAEPFLLCLPETETA
jgi:hypothetical protein